MNLDDAAGLSLVLLHALRQGGYVDPDDNTVPMWPRHSARGDGYCVWVDPAKLVADLVTAIRVYLETEEQICLRCGLRNVRKFDEPLF